MGDGHMTRDDVIRAKARAKAATPGPWAAYGTSPDDRWVVAGKWRVAEVAEWDHNEINSRFIAAARDDVPALADLALLAWDLAEVLEAAVADRVERTRRHSIGHGLGRQEEALWQTARAALARFEVVTKC